MSKETGRKDLHSLRAARAELARQSRSVWRGWSQGAITYTKGADGGRVGDQGD